MDTLFSQLGCTPRISECEARDVYKLLLNRDDAARKPVGIDGLPVAVVSGDADGDGLFTDWFWQVVIVLRNNNKKSHTSKTTLLGPSENEPESFFDHASRTAFGSPLVLRRASWTRKQCRKYSTAGEDFNRKKCGEM